MAVTLRDATSADLPAILAIHNSTIDDTTTTWSDEDETIEHRTQWFAARQAAGDPVVVAVDGGEVGEGKWPGYRHTRELSVHVRDSHRGHGVGRLLLDDLVERAVRNDVHVLVAAVDSGNEASIRFHEQMGFVEVARLPEVGRKFDRWLDLVLLQRIIEP